MTKSAKVWLLEQILKLTHESILDTRKGEKVTDRQKKTHLWHFFSTEQNVHGSVVV